MRSSSRRTVCICLNAALPLLVTLTLYPGPADAQTNPIPPPPGWVEARVGDAQARLDQTEAGRIAWAAIEAHGGLHRWYSNGPIAFRFNYAPVGDRPPNDTFEVVDTWSSRARHRLTADPDVEFGWSGTQAWVAPPDAHLGTNARFWALTPYYFVAIPFVMGDPGVNLALDGQTDFEGRTYDLVRVTYQPGTGDAPDDYYVVYVDRETHRVGGLRYVVTYPGFFPEGGHSPEKFMAYDGSQTIDGITLPESYRTFALSDAGVPDEIVTRTTLSDVAFVPETPTEAFDVPANARVIEGY